MKKNISILFCFIFNNIFMSVNKDETAKYKKENQKKSNKTGAVSVLKDGIEKSNKSLKSLPIVSLKSKEDSKELDKNNNSKKNNAKKKNNYQDPFGGLDENLFDSVGKTKIKTEEKQKNSDNKKIIKKNAEEKKNEKKENSIFSSIKSFFKGAANNIAKSDMGKQLGGVLKDASTSVLVNAVDAGKEKLNQEVISLNNKISGQNNNNQEGPKIELEIEASQKIETQIKNDKLQNNINYEDPFEGLDEKLYKNLDAIKDESQNNNDFEKEDVKKSDNPNDNISSVNSEMKNKEIILPITSTNSFVNKSSPKSKKKSKNKTRNKKNK